jgi:hypothetical protein
MMPSAAHSFWLRSARNVRDWKLELLDGSLPLLAQPVLEIDATCVSRVRVATCRPPALHQKDGLRAWSSVNRLSGRHRVTPRR